MYSTPSSIHNRLEEILDSIQLIQEWSKNRHCVSDFLSTPEGVMAFNASVMRLQVIGEHVGKLIKDPSQPLAPYPDIPWLAIYDLRNIISHEYSNIDETLIVSIINQDLPPLKDAIRQLLVQNEYSKG